MSSMSTSTAAEAPLSDNIKDWPLRRISQPHHRNDVLLSGPQTGSKNKNDNRADASTEEVVPILVPWRSSSFTSIDRTDSNESKSHEDWITKQSLISYDTVQGNQRFLELLSSHLEEFESKSSIEKPLVTVQVLKEWRNQAPPGRFLVAEPDTDPPLWKDIGDKKARARISKAFKHLTKSKNGTNDAAMTYANAKSDTSASFSSSSQIDTFIGAEDCRDTASSVTPPTFKQKKNQEEETKSAVADVDDVAGIPNVSATLLEPTACKSQRMFGFKELGTSSSETLENEKGARLVQTHQHPLENNLALPSKTNVVVPHKRPAIPSFHQNLKKNERRISEQLFMAQKDGKIYGRRKERDQLVQIYKQQRERYALFLQHQRQLKRDHPSLNKKSYPMYSSQMERFSQTSSTTVVPGDAVFPEVVFVFISGSMGVGKTCLATTLRNPPEEEIDVPETDDGSLSSYLTENAMGQHQPFFLHGKFEHCKWKDPNAVFVALIADFCDQLLKRKDPALTKQFRDAIELALQDDITLLINLVPLLTPILKKSNLELDGNKSSKVSSQGAYECLALQRVKIVFGLFLRTIAEASSHAIIVLLDDLNYASEPAMDILTSLVQDKENCGVLFMGTCPREECKSKHYLRAIERMDAIHTVSLTRIEVSNLEETSVHRMLAETLMLKEQETLVLRGLVFSLTKGNPTFIKELLRNFQDKGILRYEEASRQWTCDIEQIPLTLGDIHSVSDLFKAKILALPPSIQETLKIAACLMATQVDESLLKLVDTVGAVSSHLKHADNVGLLSFRDEKYYFVSDGAKEAAYELIPLSDRPSYHLRIGQRLSLHLQDNENAEFYATLMSQMILGDGLITADDDRRAAALLYLNAGQKAARYLGFRTAWYCLSRGIAMISLKKKWGRDNYDICLSLHNTAIEVCYCNGEFEELDSLIAEVLDNARTLEDALPARSCQIYALGSRNKQFEAITIGLNTLEELGERFPGMTPSIISVLIEARKLKRLLRNKSDDDILGLPRMKDPKKLAAMQIMNHFILYTVYASPNLSALLAFRLVRLTIEHGISAISSVGFVIYGMILCRFDQIDDGFRFGELAMKNNVVFKHQVWMVRTYAGFYGAIYCRKYNVRGALEPLQTAYRVGMRTGDIEYAVLNGCLEIWNGADLLRLPDIDSKIRELKSTAEAYGQNLSVIMLTALWQFALNMMGKTSGDPKIVGGEAIDNHILEKAKSGKNPHLIFWIRLCTLEAAYILCDYDMAEKYIDAARWIYESSSGAMDGGRAVFLECLVLLAQARRGKRRFRILRHVKKRLKMLKLWAMHAPDNYLPMQYLLEAEVAFIRGDRQKATAHYRTAILHSRETGFLLDESLANERLGRSYLEWKDTKSAMPFLEEARRCYLHWGGVVKVQHLDDEFGDMIDYQSPIIRGDTVVAERSSFL